MKVNSKLSDRELKLICLHLTEEYQTSAVKAIWDSTQTLSCIFCGQEDTHTHTLIEMRTDVNSVPHASLSKTA